MPVFDEICGMAMHFVFFIPVTLIKVANTPLDRSAALVLSLYTVHISATLQHWHLPNSARNLARGGLDRISKKWPNFGLAGAGAKIHS